MTYPLDSYLLFQRPVHERVERSTKTKTGKLQDKYIKVVFQRLDVLLTYNSVTQPHMKELAKLTTKEHFVFTLVRLRRSPSLEMLWDIFGITTGTGSRIFITWILFLEKELGFLLPFSTKEELREISKPNCFKKNWFKNLRAIIDCTEFYVGKPGKPSSQSSTYSQ